MSPLEEAAIAEVEKPSIQQADAGGRGTAGDYDAPSSVGREVRAAAIGTLAALGLAALASSGTMLSGAVTAQGSVVLDGSVKRIQNPAGGVVEAIPVRDGDRVVKGQTLMLFDRTVAGANLESLTRQLDELAMRHARLDAELAGASTLTFPADLEARQGERDVALSMAAERNLFVNRIKTAAGKRDQYARRTDELERQIDGMGAQAAAKEAESALIAKEAAGVEVLYAKALVSMNRLTTLQRDATRIEGERGQLVNQVAEARGRISETRLQAIQVDDDQRSEALKDLREVQSREADLGQKAIAARDVLAHVVVKAPVDGVVADLTQHTVGGVVSPGEVLMSLVPGDDRLVVEAKVQPQEIDSVKPGGPARVKMPGLNQRTTPELEGTVSYVGADVSQEQARGAQPAAPFYRIRVTLPANQTARLGGVRIMPGMPAEVFVTTASRSVASYLFKPLQDQLSHAMNER